MKFSIVTFLVLCLPILVLGQGTVSSGASGPTFSESFSLPVAQNVTTVTVTNNLFSYSPVPAPSGVNSTTTLSLPLGSFSQNTSLSTATETPHSGGKRLGIERGHVIVGIIVILSIYMIWKSSPLKTESGGARLGNKAGPGSMEWRVINRWLCFRVHHYSFESFSSALASSNNLSRPLFFSCNCPLIGFAS